ARVPSHQQMHVIPPFLSIPLGRCSWASEAHPAWLSSRQPCELTCDTSCKAPEDSRADRRSGHRSCGGFRDCPSNRIARTRLSRSAFDRGGANRRLSKANASHHGSSQSASPPSRQVVSSPPKISWRSCVPSLSLANPPRMQSDAERQGVSRER